MKLRKIFAHLPPAADPNHLNPQCLKEFTSNQLGEAGTQLLVVTSFTNLFVAGKYSTAMWPLLYGANLIALHKHNGGIRPIAFGNTVRWLVAKVISIRLCLEIDGCLRPTQLGYGSSDGCVAAVYPLQVFLGNSSLLLPRMVVKIDYRSAFNNIRRDTFLSVIRDQFPEISPFIWPCYSSILFWGKFTLQ